MPFMRVVVLSLALALTSAVPAVAAEKGLVTGRVTNETTGEPARGVEVVLSGADEDGSGRVRRTATTDRAGRYRFDDLPTGPDWLFVVDARFDGGLFPGRPFAFPRGEPPKLQSSLRVWNTTSDPDSVLITRDALFVLPASDGVGVVESVNVLNQTEFAYIGRGTTTTFGFGLPAGASDVGIQDASLDVPELVETDFGFGITVALPPGETDFTYSYRVPNDGSTHILSKTALYPTADLLVFAGEPLELAADRLRESGEVTIDDERYRRWTAPDLIEAGDTVLIQAEARADIPWLPFALAGAGIVAAISGAYVLARRRSRKEPVEDLRTRDDLIAAIASLDVAYESGSLEKKSWETERARLKERLMEMERA